MSRPAAHIDRPNLAPELRQYVAKQLPAFQTIPGIAGVDIGEDNPSQGGSAITAALCAELVKEVAGHMIETPG